MGSSYRKQQRAARIAAAAASLPDPATPVVPAASDPVASGGDGRGMIAASFAHEGMGLGGHSAPFMPLNGGFSLIDRQRYRNNWSKQPRRSQIRACRHYASYNWFMSAILRLRAASHGAGFRVVDEEVDYDLGALVEDIVGEDLVSSNVVCLWRKGEEKPTITVLDAERCEYRAVGGLERITLQCSVDKAMAADRDNEATYREALGGRMYEAVCNGRSITIIRSKDSDWNFVYMGNGKRSGEFVTPHMLPILDSLDFLELMGVGDWNLAWFRKDVIRGIRKGYAVTQGQNAGLNSVNLTEPDVKQIGEGFSKVNGASTIPMNHDMDPFYLTVDPANFKPESVKTAMDKVMLYGGIEGVVLLGNFSQQNGAAPSLMRNARTEAFARRARIERLLRTILAENEFSGVVGDPEATVFGWSVKSLYSIEELNALSNGLAPGIGSPQTRRGLYDLDDKHETNLLREAHKNRADYTPAFEAGQGMVPLVFPDEFPTAKSGNSGAPPGDPGRPSNDPGV